MMAYLKSRIAFVKHNRIVMSFMEKCHTKFSVDGGFSNNREMLKRNNATSLKQLSIVFEKNRTCSAVNFMKKQPYNFV